MIIKKNLLYLSLFFALIFVPMKSIYVHGAKVDGGSGYSTSGNKKGQNESLKESAVNMMEAILNITNLEGVVTQPSENDSDQPPSNSNNPRVTDGEYIMYRQGDYKYDSGDKKSEAFLLPDKNLIPKTNPPKYNRCDIAYSGCGVTAATNVIANLRDRSVNPATIAKNHYGSSKKADRYADCRGTTIAGAKAALNDFGLKSEVITYKEPTSIDIAAPELIAYLNKGTWILAGADFKYGGHYFVIIDIINRGNGYEVIGLDSAYGNRNTAPINYKQQNIPFKIKSALAVYP